MANWKLIGSIVGGVLVLGAIGNAIGDNDSPGAPSSAASSQPETAATDSKPSASASDKKAPAEKAAVANFTGMGLQSAQDTAQEAGFYGLTSHDSLGRGRVQAFDRNWKVCFQNVKAGSAVPVDTGLDFGAVKLEENCPAADEAPPSAAGGTMPDFAGKSVKAARAALDSGTSLTVDDASGDSRLVLVESNWQVCSQEPAPGAALSGQPVKLTAVKFEEACP